MEDLGKAIDRNESLGNVSMPIHVMHLVNSV